MTMILFWARRVIWSHNLMMLKSLMCAETQRVFFFLVSRKDLYSRFNAFWWLATTWRRLFMPCDLAQNRCAIFLRLAESCAFDKFQCVCMRAAYKYIRCIPIYRCIYYTRYAPFDVYNMHSCLRCRQINTPGGGLFGVMCVLLNHAEISEWIKQ